MAAKLAAKERLLIEVERAQKEAAASGKVLGPTPDPIASRELFASSRVLGTLQRECIDVRKRVHRLITGDSPASDSVTSLSTSPRASPSASRLRTQAMLARDTVAEARDPASLAERVDEVLDQCTPPLAPTPGPHASEELGALVAQGRRWRWRRCSRRTTA